jgi:hypothetical protein
VTLADAPNLRPRCLICGKHINSVSCKPHRGGAVWSAREAHNLKAAGSNPAPGTNRVTPPLKRLQLSMLPDLKLAIRTPPPFTKDDFR